MDYGSEASGPEQQLPGMFSTLARLGDTVRRSTGPWTPAVHALLRHLERVLLWAHGNFESLLSAHLHE